MQDFAGIIHLLAVWSERLKAEEEEEAAVPKASPLSGGVILDSASGVQVIEKPKEEVVESGGGGVAAEEEEDQGLGLKMYADLECYHFVSSSVVIFNTCSCCQIVRVKSYYQYLLPKNTKSSFIIAFQL